MKDLLQNKIITGLVVAATFILAGVAVFTAVRLYQVRNENVTPTTPTQSDAAGTLSPPSAPRVLRNSTWKESDPPSSGETHGSLDYASSKDEAWIAVRNNGSSSVLIKGWQNCPPRHDPDGICWPKSQDPTFEFTIQPKEVVRIEAVQVCGQLDFDQPYGYGRYFDTIKCSGSNTSTPTKTPTPTIKVTESPSPTKTPTKTPTVTKTPTPTKTPTNTPTVKLTSSPTPTKTGTPTPTTKITGSVTPTGTSTPSPTGTTPVLQSCKALTFTLSTSTGTPSTTATPTSTGTITITPSTTGSITETPTLTITPTDVPRGGGDTPTNTPTPTTGNGSSPTPTTGNGNVSATSPTPNAEDLPNAGVALPTLFAAGLGGLVIILAIGLAL